MMREPHNLPALLVLVDLCQAHVLGLDSAEPVIKFVAVNDSSFECAALVYSRIPAMYFYPKPECIRWRPWRHLCEHVVHTQLRVD
jgi:hypothetical protein